MRKPVQLLLTTFVCAFAASAQTPVDAYQVRYVANVSIGDSLINLTNAGSLGGFEPSGNICANVYVFSESQALVACCTCPLSPNHLKTLSVQSDLISNTLTAGVPTAVTVALLASSGTCNAAVPTGLVSGLRAWATTIHAAPDGSYQVDETEFSNASLNSTESLKLVTYCGFIQANGSGYGICKSCREGAAGASRSSL